MKRPVILESPASLRAMRGMRRGAGAWTLLLGLVAGISLVGCLDRDERTEFQSSHIATGDSILGRGKAPQTGAFRGRRAAAFGDADTVYIYLSPLGDDNNPGSRDRPAATLVRIQQLLKQRALDADIIVKVRSDAGVYLNQSVLWTYYRPGRSITIESDPPRVNACFVAGNDPPVGPFFALSAMRGEPTNIILRRLTVRNYVSRAVLFLGDREIRDNWNGGNAIEDCVFEGIGNARLPMQPIVYSAVGLVNSRNNRIVNCSFLDIRNHTLANFPQAPRGAAHHPVPRIEKEERKLSAIGSGSNPNIPIVCIYLAHYSDSNAIEACSFERVKGDAIRIRDDSNGNVIAGNRFELVGWNAIVSMWQCDSPRLNCMKELVPEKVSTGNAILRNTARGNWRGGMPVLFVDMRAAESPSGASKTPMLGIMRIEGNDLDVYR